MNDSYFYAVIGTWNRNHAKKRNRQPPDSRESALRFVCLAGEPERRSFAESACPNARRQPEEADFLPV
ncbi:hypothetical protein KP806_17900 [Paenibacillus sp. N4]|uniref:hypothetical protein n=1 Tax=Paenibacillus vietnamensis TaxID=2590547 RepID=UPI001CD10028|nr:hypothetical protein [Paenibacillus vietnamensis]MCA0756936.1 hypothetical protein [Paenibacillus vietnamensis]